MSLTRNRKIGIAALAVAIAAVAVWAIWFRGGVQKGPGPFTAELAACRTRVSQEIQHVPNQEHLENTVWRQGNADELHIGGAFRLPAENGRLTLVNYECVAQRGRVIRVEVW